MSYLRKFLVLNFSIFLNLSTMILTFSYIHSNRLHANSDCMYGHIFCELLVSENLFLFYLKIIRHENRDIPLNQRRISRLLLYRLNQHN